MTQTPPQRPPDQVSLADLKRFVQQGGMERAARNFVQSSADAFAVARSAAQRSADEAKRWVAEGGPQRWSRYFDAAGTQIKAGAEFSKTNAKWLYLANRMGGGAGAMLIFALAGRASTDRAEELTHERRRLAGLSDAAVVPPGDVSDLPDTVQPRHMPDVRDQVRRNVQPARLHVRRAV